MERQTGPASWKKKREYVEHHNRMIKWAQSMAPNRDIGVPMHVRQIQKSGLSDYWRLWRSLAAWVQSAFPTGVSIETVVSASSEANAWPFRHALGRDQHLLIVTDSAIKRMQKLASLLPRAAEAEPKVWQGSTTLSAVFPKENRTSEDFEAFAQVVLQAAFVFLFNHELAHLHNGHDGCAASTSTLDWYAELAARPARIRRTVEFDADASAFAWTLFFYSRYNADPQLLTELGATRARVLDSCMKNLETRLTIVSMGALVFHLALSNEAHGRDGEHPSFRERVRLSRLASRNHAQLLRINSAPDTESVILATALIARDALHDEEDRIIVGKRIEDEERPFFRLLLDALLADDSEQGSESDVDRHREMAQEMLRIERDLSTRRIPSALPKVDWWSASTDISATA